MVYTMVMDIYKVFKNSSQNNAKRRNEELADKNIDCNIKDMRI